MRISRPAEALSSHVISMEGATRFGPILDGLANRLGSGWYLEASRTCDGKSILLVMAAADEIDCTVTVTETAGGFLVEELKADRLSRIAECQKLEQVSARVARHLLPTSTRLGFAFKVHSSAA